MDLQNGGGSGSGVAGAGSSNPFPPPFPPKNYALSGRIMLSAIVTLFTVVLLILCLHIYARWYHFAARQNRRQRRRQRRREQRRIILTFEHLYNNHNMNSAVTPRGLDPDLLKSIPVFTYTARSRSDGPDDEADELECAVCLSEFQENEKGRTLPECKHSFHTECVDMWFFSHSTCPLCRSLVESVDIPLPVSSEQVGVEVAGEPSDLCDSCRHEEDEAAGTSRGGGGIRIEVPPRRVEEIVDMKSPENRKASLKRMLSWNSFRLTRGGGGSSNEPDLEKGAEDAVVAPPPQQR